MKQNQIFWPSLLMFSVLMIAFYGFGPGNVFASEEGGPDWRPKYDMIMMWLNFGILVFILVKFGRKPLMNFLHSQKDELANEIEGLEKEKARISEEIGKTQQALKESDAHFADLKEKIIRQGEQKREDIIKEAKQQTDAMMETARQKISGRILAARREFKAEMVDAAFDMATERISKEITPDDSEKIVRRYMKFASAETV